MGYYYVICSDFMHVSQNNASIFILLSFFGTYTEFCLGLYKRNLSNQHFFSRLFSARSGSFIWTGLFSTCNAQILLSQKSFDVYVTHGVAVSPLSRHRVEHFLVMFVQVSNLWFHTYLGEGVGKKTLKGHKIWSLILMNPYLIQ